MSNRFEVSGKIGKSTWPVILVGISLAAAINLTFFPVSQPISRAILRILGFAIPAVLAGRAYLQAARQQGQITRLLTGIILLAWFFRLLEDLFLSLSLTLPPEPLLKAWFAWIDLAGWIALAASLTALLFLQQRIAIKLKILLDLFITTGSFLVLWYVIFLNPVVSSGNPDLAISPDVIWFSLEDVFLTILTAYVYLFVRQTAHRKFLGMILLTCFAFYITDTFLHFEGIAQNNTLFVLSAVTQWLGYTSLWYSARFALRLEEEIREQSSTRQLTTGWAIQERILETLPIALALVMVVELLVFWQRNLIIEQWVLVSSAVIWLLLVARLGVAAGEFEMQQYTLLFLNSAEAAFLCGPNLRLIQVNPAMVRLCGYDSRDSLINRDLREVLPNYDDLIKLQPNQTAETILVHTTKQRIPVELSRQTIVLGFFKRKYHTGVIHDLTFQKNQQEMLQQAYDRVQSMQQELQQMNDVLEHRVVEKTASLESAYRQLEEQNIRLQSLDQMKSDFVSLVSHELRAPLTNISGGIELLLSGKKQISESIRSSLLLVQMEIKRLTRFVETILDLSVLDAGKLPLYPERIEAADFISLIRTHYQNSPGANRIQWPEITPGMVLMVDVQALQSVFIHVLDNAQKYAPGGDIKVILEKTGQIIRCTISDSGPGIPEHLREQIFEKFFRSETADARYIYGHGLGLYMARKLLEGMQGTISVSDSVTGGAAFVIQLPDGETKE